MEEKKRSEFVEKGSISSCCEPTVDYAETGSDYANTMVDSNEMIAKDFDPDIGPYTIDELNSRIDEAETFISQAEKGDWSNWVTEDQSRAKLYSKYSWLR